MSALWNRFRAMPMAHKIAVGYATGFVATFFWTTGEVAANEYKNAYRSPNFDRELTITLGAMVDGVTAGVVWPVLVYTKLHRNLKMLKFVPPKPTS